MSVERVGGFATRTSLDVGDLDPNIMDAQLYDLFNQLGQVISVRVCRDLTSRRSLGYGYVNFSNPQDVVVLLSCYIFIRLPWRNLVHLIFLLLNRTNVVDSNFFLKLTLGAKWVSPSHPSLRLVRICPLKLHLFLSIEIDLNTKRFTIQTRSIQSTKLDLVDL